jgi:AraC-like DNA-binding protein
MYQPSIMEVPEWAIQVFEKQNDLRVVVHDLTATLGPFLQPERFKHRATCCIAVKARHDWACMDFEMTRLRAELPDFPEGRYHRCHAGFMEWVVPVFIKERLAWILFAGQRRAEGDYRHLFRDVRTTAETGVQAKALRATGEAEAEAILESLRQLRSRLLEWHGQVSVLLKNTRQPEAGGARDMAGRRRLIQNFLHATHTESATSLADLAKALHLGESRASHLVKELFGRSYVELLNELRLRTAAELLRASALSVTEVCLNSGFSDVSHFHRCFQKRFATTPLKYRRMSHA